MPVMNRVKSPMCWDTATSCSGWKYAPSQALPASRTMPTTVPSAGLEAELKNLYRREAELQTRIAQQDQRYALRERQISALTTERDTLIRRLEELEKLLAAARGQRH